MKKISRILSAAVVTLGLLATSNPVFATTCSASIIKLASGGSVLSVRTDAASAVSVIVVSSSGQVLQRLALSRGSASDLAAFPVLAGSYYDFAFVNKKGAAICLERVRIPANTDPTGGNLPLTGDEEPGPGE